MKTLTASMRLGSSRRTENTASVRHQECRPEPQRRPRAQPVRVGEPERREQERRELRPARERDGRTPRDGRRREPEAPDEERRHDRVVRVRVQRVGGEREGEPAERERDGELRAAEPAADEEQAEDDEQVERDRGRMRRGQRVPLPRPDAASAPPARRRGRRWDRTCRRAGWRTRSGRSAGSSRGPSPSVSAGPQARPVSATGMWPYGASAVEDPVAADHAGVADVDHPARGLEIEADPEAAEKDGNGREQPHRPGQRRVRSAAAEPDPGGTHEQVGERQRPERRAPEDLAPVEATRARARTRAARAGRACATSGAAAGRRDRGRRRR